MKRTHPNQKKARKVFTKTALKCNRKNTMPTPMRGGFRI